MNRVLWSALVVSFLACTSQGALVTKSKSQHGDRTINTVATLGKAVLQVQMLDGSRVTQTSVMDLNDESFAIFHHESKSVHRFKLKELAETMKGAGRAMKQLGGSPEAMKAMLKNLPPDQRKALEAVLGGNKPGKPAQATAPKKISSGHKVGKWKCDRYEQIILGHRFVQCFTQDFALNADEKATSRRLDQMLRQLTEAMPIGVEASEALHISDKYGVSVESVSYADKSVDHRSELVSIERTGDSDASLKGPSGYREEKSPLSK